jgi:energy-coupling factor transport system permease protein
MSSTRVGGRLGRSRRAGLGSVLMSRLPGDSPLHRVWIGTKIVALALLTVELLIDPGWARVVSLAALLALAVIAGRVPRNAVPRIPLWFWAIVLIGLLLSLSGNGAAHYLRLLALSMTFTGLSLVVAWTSDPADVVSAVVTLGGPLRRLRLPVEEWAIVCGLAVRILPLLVDECRTLLAARRMRGGSGERRPAAVLAGLVDLVSAAMSSAVRRGMDLGAAITARGGVGASPAGGPRPGRQDVVALAIVVVVCILPSVV